jgi:hypothetical protein
MQHVLIEELNLYQSYLMHGRQENEKKKLIKFVIMETKNMNSVLIFHLLQNG